MTDTIHLSTLAQVETLLPLVTETALAKCTKATWHEDASEWRITTIRPVQWLSTGEQNLWEILRRLAVDDQIPTDLYVRAGRRLDPENWAAVQRAIDALWGALAADAASELAFESARDARAER